MSPLLAGYRARPAHPKESTMATRTPLFPLGQVVATPGALELLTARGVEPRTLLRRHVSGDWGDIAPSDSGLNEQALKSGDRVLSVYHLTEGTDATVWIITNGTDDAGTRDATTFLLPSDY